MKYIFILIFCITSFVNPQGRKTMNEIEKKLDEIRLKFIPDLRTDVFLFNTKEENGKTVISVETNILPLKKEIEKFFSGDKYKTNVELLPSAELANNIYGIINLSVANFRVNPSHTAEMATQGLLGHPVKIYKKMKGYFLAQTEDKYVSWVDDDGIELMDEAEINSWNSSDKIIFTSNFGTCFSESSINSTPISDLVKGDILKKISNEGEFIKVQFPDKRIAYVLSSEAETYDKWVSDLSTDNKSVVTTAFKFMGFPYLWGGTSTKGMDCSGFTKTVYFNNGYILPRDASQQVNSGDPVDISKGFENLLPGDLLFFGSKADGTRKERVTHVAIYIGNNDFIHSSGRVRINSLDNSKNYFSAYRFNSLLGAKRILGAENMNGIIETKNLFKKAGVQQ